MTSLGDMSCITFNWMVKITVSTVEWVQNDKTLMKVVYVSHMWLCELDMV
jgi:hypothetical protein